MNQDLFIPLLVLIAVTLGCSTIRDMATKGTQPAGSNSNTGTSNSSGSKGSTTASADPKQDIINASTKFIELPFFSAKMEGTGGSDLHMQIDYAAPDKYRILYLAGTAAGMETIIIGKQMYMKAGGKWIKTSGNGDTIPNLRDSFTEEGLKTMKDLKFDGEDNVAGKAALIYSYKNVTPKGDFPFTSKIWIGKETGLPMKIEVNYENGTLKQMNVAYDTETPVTIEPPIS